ncbi:hypothetical protein J7J83_04350 [bacterium]|nr:hypothetical protein [bacterium]
MYSLIQLLLKIGLTEKEAQTYLTSLKVGTNPASIIAKYSGLNRCTTYSVLESLMKKGLMNQIKKDTTKYFTSVGPRQLMLYLEEKERDIAFYKNEVSSKITQFNSLRHPNQVLPTIKSYSGTAGIKKLHNEALDEPFLLINAQKNERQDKFFTQYAPIFLNEKKTIHLAIINNQNIKITNQKGLENIPNCIPLELIGKNKLFILDRQDHYGIEIRQSHIIETHQKQFHYLWNIKKDLLP